MRSGVKGVGLALLTDGNMPDSVLSITVRTYSVSG
jgi:hypothetical protein